MPVFVVTGNLGAGKTLVAASRIQKYLNEGRRVATNLDLWLDKMIDPNSKRARCVRLPDIPTVESFKCIGRGYEGDKIDENKNGLVVLDECALWLNSRDWNDKERKKLIDHFVHLRKLRWDLIILIQDIEALDKQFRALYAEHTVYCSRLDRYKIPYIGWILNLFLGSRIPMPRVHIGAVYYNAGKSISSKVENWVYRGTDLFEAYDTEQSFNTPDSPSIYSYLPPFYLRGKNVSKSQLFKAKFKGISIYHLFFLGLLAGGGVVKAYTPDGTHPDRGTFSCNADWETLFGDCSLSIKEVQTIIAQHKSGKAAPSNAEDSGVAPFGVTSEAQVLEKPQPRVYISGSVSYANGDYEYVFNDYETGHTWNAYAAGYRVYDYKECHATLVSMDDKSDRFDVFCK